MLQISQMQCMKNVNNKIDSLSRVIEWRKRLYIFSYQTYFKLKQLPYCNCVFCRYKIAHTIRVYTFAIIKKELISCASEMICRIIASVKIIF